MSATTPSGGKPKRGGKRTTSWAPGKSGNPSGSNHYNKAVADLRKAASDLFGPHAQEAADTIIGIMRDGSSDKVRLDAAQIVVERVYGRAPQAVEVTGADGGPLVVAWSELIAAVKDKG